MRRVLAALAASTALLGSSLPATSASAASIYGPAPSGCHINAPLRTVLVKDDPTYPKGDVMPRLTSPGLTCNKGSKYKLTEWVKMQVLLDGKYQTVAVSINGPTVGYAPGGIWGATLCDDSPTSLAGPGSKWRGVLDLVFVSPAGVQSRSHWIAPNSVTCP